MPLGTAITIRNSERPASEIAAPDYIDDLVREFFRVHQITAALDAFASERPEGRRNVDAITVEDERLLGHNSAIFRAEHGISRLEAFVVSWNQVEHAMELQTARHETKPIKPKKKTPPTLTIQAAAVPEVNDAVAPKVAMWDMGAPGCTPKPRVQDLKSFGFDDVDDLSNASAMTVGLSPVLDKFKPRTRYSKKVSIGEAGATPKKEYIFYRETPPSFVTESEEAAREVMEKLSHDPLYAIVPAEAQQRFVELSSSDVGKYAIGKRVDGLGAARSISGVVAKKYGSKQCGTSGPGTIVIDTQPDDDTSSSTAPPPTTFSAEDEALIDSLLDAQ
ncbi:hypothetical protein H310_00044, partial [Aphanomyces invadans]